MTASVRSQAAFADAGAGKADTIDSLTPSVKEQSRTSAAVPAFVPGPVLLLGAPGVGKGTQAKLLMAEFGVPQISTGDILRSNIAQGTPLGITAKSLMDKGHLVPDQVVNDMVGARLAQPDTSTGYVLDGFPRTLAQAEWLDDHLSTARSMPPIVAIKIHVAHEELLRRITGRRTCPSCGRIYNIYFHPPAKDEICDVDGTPLVYRSDDTEPAFRERMRAYEALTAPVIQHYQKIGRYREIAGAGTVEEVEMRIVEALRELRGAMADARRRAASSEV